MKRIKTPGQFEGEMYYVPYFWKLGIEGMADEDDGVTFTFRLTAEDKERFPELRKRRTLKLREDGQGFVYEL